MIFLPNVPQLAVYWHPNPQKIPSLSLVPYPFLTSLLLLPLLSLIRHSRNLKAFAATRSLQRPWKAKFNAAGVSIDDGLGRFHYSWAKFDHYQETKTVLTLVTEDNAKLFIPKRALADTTALDALCSMIHARIAKGTFLERGRSFEVIPIQS